MSEMKRRDFVKGAAVVAASASMIGPKVWAQANSKIRVGVVGLFGRGQSHLDGFSNLGPDVEVAAICDVDERVMMSNARRLEMKTGKAPKTVKDMRQLFDDKEIDVVSFATPNHWHSLGTIWACQAGKDVYVEKPLSHNVFEGRQAVKAARKYNRIVQVGTQSRSNEGMREGIQKLKDGAIGDVYMARGLCYKWRPAIGKAEPTTPPEGFDYDLWTGPAEMQPFTRNRHPYKWHWFWNTGNGDIGNQGVHEMDKARWGLGVGLPKQINAHGGHFLFDDDQETPNVMTCTFNYPDEKKVLVFEVRGWISNDEWSKPEAEPDTNTVGNIFYGRDGIMVMPNYSSYQIFLGKNKEAQPAVSRGGDHFKNFIDSVRSRKMEDLACDVEEGHQSAAMCHLANISYRLGKSLDFDPATEKFKNDLEADKLLTRPYRAPFVVPEEV